jgi:hypothetical protein
VNKQRSFPSHLHPSERLEDLQSSYVDDPMTRLWQNAQDKPTGAEAVEAIRARRRNLGSQAQFKKTH